MCLWCSICFTVFTWMVDVSFPSNRSILSIAFTETTSDCYPNDFYSIKLRLFINAQFQNISLLSLSLLLGYVRYTGSNGNGK